MGSSFRTELALKKGFLPEISHYSSLLLIGSCFSDRIGSRFVEGKFRTISNPFGVTYNTASIERQMRIITGDLSIEDSGIIKKGELYNNFDLHGSFDALSKEELLSTSGKIIAECRAFLKSCSHIFISPATAWVYVRKSTGITVNNCHKFPSSEFEKRMLSTGEVTGHLINILKIARNFNPGICPIFTISPVRHLKDGFAENSLSKSVLRLGISEAMKSGNSHYFPSYEMVMDDLRDYRFYEDDLVHPNDLAADYIWNALCHCSMSDETIKRCREVTDLKKQLQHRPFMPGTKAHRKFLDAMLAKARKLGSDYPEINLEAEIKEIGSRLSAE